MKFIFPKNYNFKSKILGVIDYSTAIFNLIILFVIFFILNLLIKDISVKIFFIILLYLPILLFELLPNVGNFLHKHFLATSLLY